MCRVSIYLSSYITNVLVPFLDSLTWLSKKELDYLDWKIILRLKNKGLHFTAEGKEIISLICFRMNNNRLSTNFKTSHLVPNLDNRIDSLLTAPSNFEIHSNGKIFIKSLGVYLKGRGEVQIELFDINNILVNTFPSIKTCASYLNLTERTLVRRLDSRGNILFEGQIYYAKRVASLPNT